MCHLGSQRTAGPELMRWNRRIYYESFSKVERARGCLQSKESDDPTDGSGDIPSMRLSQTFDSVVSAGVREPRVC